MHAAPTVDFHVLVLPVTPMGLFWWKDIESALVVIVLSHSLVQSCFVLVLLGNPLGSFEAKEIGLLLVEIVLNYSS